jgi:hypothetical protein
MALIVVAPGPWHQLPELAVVAPFTSVTPLGEEIANEADRDVRTPPNGLPSPDAVPVSVTVPAYGPVAVPEAVYDTVTDDGSHIAGGLFPKLNSSPVRVAGGAAAATVGATSASATAKQTPNTARTRLASNTRRTRA